MTDDSGNKNILTLFWTLVSYPGLTLHEKWMGKNSSWLITYHHISMKKQSKHVKGIRSLLFACLLKALILPSHYTLLFSDLWKASGKCCLPNGRGMNQQKKSSYYQKIFFFSIWRNYTIKWQKMQPIISSQVFIKGSLYPVNRFCKGFHKRRKIQALPLKHF